MTLPCASRGCTLLQACCCTLGLEGTELCSKTLSCLTDLVEKRGITFVTLHSHNQKHRQFAIVLRLDTSKPLQKQLCGPEEPPALVVLHLGVCEVHIKTGQKCGVHAHVLVAVRCRPRLKIYPQAWGREDNRRRQSTNEAPDYRLQTTKLSNSLVRTQHKELQE